MNLEKTTSALKYTLLFKSIGQICSIAATILLVRALSEHDYGIYNLLYSLIGLIGTIASLGLYNTLQRFIPEYFENGEFSTAQTLFRTASLLRLITDIVVLGLIMIFWQSISPLLKITAYKNYFLLFSAVVILHQQRSMIEICLTSHFLHKYTKAFGILFSAFRICGYGTMILLEKNLWWAISIDIVAYALIFTLLKILYHKKIPLSGGKWKFTPDVEKKRLKKYALLYNFNNTGTGFLNADFDNFIIVMILNPAAVGAYSFFSLLSIQITSLLPIRYLKDVIMPAFFAYTSSSGPKDRSNLLFQWLVKTNFIFALPCLFFIILFSQDLIRFCFDGKFIEYTPILSVMFSFSVINSIPVGIVAQYRERADIVLYSKIFSIYNLVADVVLISFFGIWGAAVATGSAILAKNCFIWFFVRQDANFCGMSPFFIKILLFWLSIALITQMLLQSVPLPIPLELILGILIFSIAFFLQFRLDYYSLTEKKALAQAALGNPRLNLVLKALSILS